MASEATLKVWLRRLNRFSTNLGTSDSSSALFISFGLLAVQADSLIHPLRIFFTLKSWTLQQRMLFSFCHPAFIQAKVDFLPSRFRYLLVLPSQWAFSSQWSGTSQPVFLIPLVTYWSLYRAYASFPFPFLFIFPFLYDSLFPKWIKNYFVSFSF